jgi:hypothetical protein
MAMTLRYSRLSPAAGQDYIKVLLEPFKWSLPTPIYFGELDALVDRVQI